MDVRIGVTYSPKEIEVDLADDDSDAVRSRVEAALAAGETSVLWFTDRKGRQVGVPTGKLAYVEIGARDNERRIGFAGG
ncbi:MAG: DUF3107 domain-containing protein [Acidimicrobiia bacterium]